MDKLHAMTVFVNIVDCGSMTSAAEALGTSLPSVVRTLGMLEGALGVRLLNRTTRRIRLTEEGREYLERCRRILADVEDSETFIRDRQSVATGRLAVTAPIGFGQSHVAPAIAAFIKQYPQIEVNLVLVDRVINLVEEGIDAAIRVGHLPDSSLIAIPVGQVRRVVCASPAYLKRHTVPKAPHELAKHNCLRFTGLTPTQEWEFIENGKRMAVQVNGTFSSNLAAPVTDACLAGNGIGIFLSYQVSDHVKNRKLRYVLEKFEPAPYPVHVVYPHAKLLSRRVRAFVDWMKSSLSEVMDR